VPFLHWDAVRRTLAAFFLVAACLLPAAALTTWWAYAQATDTARFTATARPLATDDAVQRQVVDELVAVADARLGDVPAAGLPGGRVAVRAQIRAGAEALVRTEAYRQTWRSVQRSAHARLAARLGGDVTAPLTLELAPIAADLRARLRATPALAPIADTIGDPDPVVLLDRAEVRRARNAVDAVRIVRGIAIPGAVIALLGVVLTAPRLGAGLLRAGLCLGVATLLVVAGDALAGSAIPASGAAGELRLAVYDVLTDPLHGWVVGGLVAAVVLVIAGAGLTAATRPRGPATAAWTR
jgi:hypothetical protein